MHVDGSRLKKLENQPKAVTGLDNYMPSVQQWANQNQELEDYCEKSYTSTKNIQKVKK